ncbi:THUMP domain-containing protein 2 isoform X1 [Suricata suricatta]|uniref:THUMP domain-containing protein 2 isoform X1 n=1 Tax=Suricata suricatta TaxID=37032 RepID=UPI001155690E|nr:THUMP domain-containing protein 2 isoform X1 [Suricata suricatta]
MAAVPTDSGSRPAAGARFFCTAGRGLEPFLMREVRARLAATQVEYISGKVFFTTCSDLNMLKKLKSAERLFLLIKKQFPLNVSSVSKGKILNEIERLINGDPESWLNTVSTWKNLLELDAKEDKLFQRAANLPKRKGEENDINAKKLKTEQLQELQENRECQPEKQIEEETQEQGDFLTKREKSQEAFQNNVVKAPDAQNQNKLTFRVSCRCSGVIAKAFTAQEVGRVTGIALMKQFGWKADLRNPNLEIFLHLNDIYSVVGIPVFRVPLASRVYIRTAGLRSTVAWAMATLADIQFALPEPRVRNVPPNVTTSIGMLRCPLAPTETRLSSEGSASSVDISGDRGPEVAGAFVLDPMCGLGTVLLEAAKEWPDVYYVGADVSGSQLLGACDNLEAAGLKDKIELLQVSVTDLPLPSESVDVIISDIPFGKKFKLEKDIKSILQEMERVLHVGGTIVLLLSEEHHRRLKDGEQRSSPLNSKGSRTDEPEPGVKKCLNPGEKTGMSETVPSSFQSSNQECLDRMPPFGSLVPVERHKVSLGRTDAFICKYRKLHSSGL